MKKTSILFFFLAGMAFAKAHAPDNGQYIAKAQEMLAKLRDAKYDEVATYFDESVAAKINSKILKQAWESLPGKLGNLNKTGTVRTEESNGLHIVYIPCEYDKATLDLKIPFKDNQKAVGFMFVPHVSDPAAYKLPGYANLPNIEEKDITVQTGKYKLPGVLLTPKNAGKKFPCVILVHGSGPNDMDESVGANKPFKDLAYGLVSKNIAVVRYDKRTKTYGSQMAENTKLTLEEETIQDAISAIKLARQIPGVDTNMIFVLGHSLGAMAAPQIAVEAGKSLAGIIMMAGPARPLEDLLLEQTIYLSSLHPSAQSDKAIADLKKQIDMLRNGALSPKTPSEQLPFNIPANYWIYLNQYKQAEVAKQLKMPILVLQGTRDYQVTMTDFNIWKSALADNKKAYLKSYPTLNHLFMEGEGARSKPEEYEVPSHVPEYVIEDIAHWVNTQN